MHEQRQGFSLIEAILTVVILGILAMVVLPRFTKEGFINGLSLRSSCSQITSDIRLTRQLAVTNNNNYWISFNCAQKEYRIYDNSATQVGQTKKIPAEVSCLPENDVFNFTSLGNCIGGSTLNLSLSTNQYSINVEGPTGAVAVEKIQ